MIIGGLGDDKVLKSFMVLKDFPDSLQKEYKDSSEQYANNNKNYIPKEPIFSQYFVFVKVFRQDTIT